MINCHVIIVIIVMFVGLQVKAKFDFVGMQQDDLAFRKGDILEILESE